MSTKQSKLVQKTRDFLIIFVMFLFISLVVKLITDYTYFVSNFGKLLFNAVIVSSLASLAMLFVYRKKRDSHD